MTVHMDRIIDKLSLGRLIAAFALWIFAFALLYWLLPAFDPGATLNLEGGAISSDFQTALFFSLGTATTADITGILPGGSLKTAAAIEIVGGLVFAGTAINLLASLPSRTTRLAAKACTGWWLEEVKTAGRSYYSLTLIKRVGNILAMEGENYDDDGPMDNTVFTAQLITTYFPMMISRYQNDNVSLDYTDGFQKFDMKAGNSGNYERYVGCCYDRRHGCRDRIVGRKLDARDAASIPDHRSLTRDEFNRLILKYFPGRATTRAQQQPPPADLASPEAGPAS